MLALAELLGNYYTRAGRKSPAESRVHTYYSRAKAQARKLLRVPLVAEDHRVDDDIDRDEHGAKEAQTRHLGDIAERPAWVECFFKSGLFLRVTKKWESLI